MAKGLVPNLRHKQATLTWRDRGTSSSICEDLRIVYVEMDVQRHLIQPPCNQTDCSLPHPTWPWMFIGMGHLPPLWTTCPRCQLEVTGEDFGFGIKFYIFALNLEEFLELVFEVCITTIHYFQRYERRNGSDEKIINKKSTHQRRLHSIGSCFSFLPSLIFCVKYFLKIVCRLNDVSSLPPFPHRNYLKINYILCNFFSLLFKLSSLLFFLPFYSFSRRK